MPSYDKWKKRLAGERVLTSPDPDENDIGFYRKSITEKQPNGRNKIIGWEPVAYFMHEGMLCGRINDRDMTGNEVIDLWTWCCAHPITEDQYRAVAERGEKWFDDVAPPDTPARVIGPDHNAPPEILTDKDHGIAIDNAIAAAIKVVTNENEAANALGSKNRIAELRLAADKAGKALYEPPYRQYKALHAAWSPMVARATAAETALNRSILTFREKERQRIAAEQAAADAKQREIDEANERAAQRAIAAGVQEPAPEIIEVQQPAVPAPILPTYGTRKIKEELRTILDAITDYDAIYNFLKAEPKVKALLLELATAKIKAGFTVPGTTTRKGLI